MNNFIKIQVLFTFKHIHLTFMHNNQLISGTLNGNILHWEFTSENKNFKKYVPSGVLIPRFSFTKSNIDYDQFMNDFYKVADELLNI